MSVDQTERKKVVDVLRACLIAAKHGINVEKLQSAYREMEGKNIPYRALGYKSMDEFLDTGVDFCTIRYGPNREIVVHAKATKESAHIQNLVRGQANTKTAKAAAAPKFFSPRHPNHVGFRPNFSPAFAESLVRGQSRRGRGQRSNAPQRKPIQKQVFPGFSGNQSNNNNNNNNVDYVQQLKEFCSANELILEGFKTSPLGNKHFMSTVIVGEDRFRTYPTEYKSKEAAENAVSKHALEALKKSICVKPMSSNGIGRVPSPIENESNPEQSGIDLSLVDQICQLLGERLNGMWSTQIEVDYKRKYKRVLPSNWILELKKLPNAKVRVDSPIDGRYIVLPNVTPSITSTEESVESQLPKLDFPKLDDSSWRVYVCHVPSVSNIFVRFEDYTHMYNELSLSMELKDREFKGVDDPAVGKIYAVKMDTNWHRVKVLDKESRGISSLFIDTGEKEIIPSSSLKQLDSKFLKLPPQALCLKLSGLNTLDSNKRNALEAEKMLLGKTFYAKVDSIVGEDISVLLFESPNEEISANQQLLAGRLSMPPLENLSPTSRHMSKSGDSIWDELASYKELSLPAIPPAGSYFDVTVTLAASPSNFTVQSWNDGDKLEDLQTQMNYFYDNPSNCKNMTKQELSEDKFFALKYLNDNSWYRIKINSVVDDDTVSVKFVDFGDVTVANIKHIQRLNVAFRNLPMQAINASLTDIIPVNGDWTAQDTVWFSERVVEKQFVSCIKLIGHDQEDDGMVKIGVSLVDTTDPHTDIFIDKELVEANRAVYHCIT